MFTAITENNRKVDIDWAVIHPNVKYYCPCCHARLIVKNGKINAAHFAHENLVDCDDFSNDMSDWHKNWQERFPVEHREIVITHDIDELNFHHESLEYDFYKYKTFVEQADAFEDLVLAYQNNNSKNLHMVHRADVCFNGYVIEFQHSPISAREFNERNWFYSTAGYKVIWIFDMQEQYDDGKMECYDEWFKGHSSGGKYKWTRPSKTFISWNPKYNKNVDVYFQIADFDDASDSTYFEKVMWVIEDEEGDSNLKRFFTDYYPGNMNEIVNEINKKSKNKYI